MKCKETSPCIIKVADTLLHRCIMITYWLPSVHVSNESGRSLKPAIRGPTVAALLPRQARVTSLQVFIRDWTQTLTSQIHPTHP